MRITAADKAETRKRIISVAKTLFQTRGFDAATTRDIAKEVGIAAGTMFNYFSSKEALVVELASQSLEKAEVDFAKSRRPGAPLDETLFASVAAQLRSLKPLRKYLRPLLETALSPAAPQDVAEASLRSGLYEHFAGILREHGVCDPSPLQLNLFWSLYIGVLSYWGNDTSPKQEDSLALLDQSIRMYVGWLKL
ncbi:MAG: TetR/AcrR family transcriptional regulator [Planctomycetota bacterium]